MIGIYARVSTEEQARSGYSLQDQLRECRKKAGNSEVIEYVDEGVSGEFLDRPALTKLRQDVREGLITKLICLDPDRLSRRLMNQLLISDELERHALLEFVNGEYLQNPEGRLFYQMRGAISEFEKAKITERFSRGRREKARQGRIVRDYKVYGYNYDSADSMFIINEYEAKIVKLIYDLFTGKSIIKTKGINGIAIYLTEMKIPTKRGAKIWHRQVVRQILMNRAYIGEFYQNRWNTEGMLGNKFKDRKERIPMRIRPQSEWILVPCPKIIDCEQFEYARELLNVSRQRWAGSRKHGYLLSGLVRCGICGNTMTGRRTKNWGKYVYQYTDLKNTAGAKSKGCGKKITAEQLETMVWEQVLGWLNRPDKLAVCLEQDEYKLTISFEEAQLGRLEQELENREKGIKQFLKLITSGGVTGISQDEIDAALLEAGREIEELKNNLNMYKNLVSSNSPYQLSGDLLKEAAEYYLFKAPAEMRFSDKQELIRSLIKEIWVYDDEIRLLGF
ncbi:MAG: recombinase family protein [Desulfitobacteriaceae bacterium]|nr:recombinase family protein [Desulfitobacteriaceae bacterium]MDD4347111.1 recombinase family protein [Desulfitobacteriaceae bacterium]MDD4401583.1 recombinase family protein [Desulfitobacteriaceae bacterium]